MPVVAFFGWLGVCALVSWRTAFQMPDGYGNAIFLLQIPGALASSWLLALALDTLRWRGQRVKLAIAGGVVFLVTNVGGWFLDVAMGLPDRYTLPIAIRTQSWARTARPSLEPCLARFWTAAPETCQVRYRVSVRGGAARTALRSVACPSEKIAECVRAHLDGGAFTLDRRQLDSLEFAGAIESTVSLDGLRGTGPPPPAERD